MMLEFIFRKISNQFLSEASLELNLPENHVASYDLFLAGTADNPFVLFTTHTLVKHSLFLTHKSVAAEVREENHVLITRSVTHLEKTPHFINTSLPWQVDTIV